MEDLIRLVTELGKLPPLTLVALLLAVFGFLVLAILYPSVTATLMALLLALKGIAPRHN